MKRTFENAKKEISEKYNYLILLEFIETNSDAKFLDKEYGIFIKNFRSVLRGLSGHPERGKKNKLEKLKKTNIDKYGVEYPQQNKKIRDKTKQIFLQKYNVDNPNKINGIQEKRKKTCLEKYGVEHNSKSEKIKKKKKETYIKNFGVESPLQSEIIKEKIKKNNIKKYGVEHISQIECVKNKVKQTCLEKYGVEHFLQLKSVRDKLIKHNINSGTYHNINGKTLLSFFNESNLDIAYSTLHQNYVKYGDEALNNDFYFRKIKSSKIANLWLDVVESNFDYHLIREYAIPNTRYIADGYDPNTNIIYEFYGDYWHGCPFKNMGINKQCDNSFNTLYYKTLERQEIIKSFGYNIIYIWENDLK